ncbi:MAG: hypothetical protein ACOYL6_12700 [Bacteriovoracaceae bacterium]
MKFLLLFTLTFSASLLAAKPASKKKIQVPKHLAKKSLVTPTPTATLDPNKVPEAPEEPLLGEDQNKDGIRDDIYFWIETEISKANEKEALKQIAIYLQQGLVAGQNLPEAKTALEKDSLEKGKSKALKKVTSKEVKSLIENQNKILKAYGCLYSVVNSDAALIETYNNLLISKFYNTDSRKKAKEKIDKVIKEENPPVPVPKNEPICEFALKP